MDMVACSRTDADDLAANRARILFGLIVMLVGIMFMADRLDWMGFRLNVPLVIWGAVDPASNDVNGKGAGR